MWQVQLRSHESCAHENCREIALERGGCVIAATRALDLFPLSGRVVPGIVRSEIREVIFDRHFRIVCKVRRVFCDILSVRHTAFQI